MLQEKLQHTDDLIVEEMALDIAIENAEKALAYLNGAERNIKKAEYKIDYLKKYTEILQSTQEVIK